MGKKEEAILWSEELIRFAIELWEELVVVECTQIKSVHKAPARSSSKKKLGKLNLVSSNYWMCCRFITQALDCSFFSFLWVISIHFSISHSLSETSQFDRAEMNGYNEMERVRHRLDLNFCAVLADAVRGGGRENCSKIRNLNFFDCYYLT